MCKVLTEAIFFFRKELSLLGNQLAGFSFPVRFPEATFNIRHRRGVLFYIYIRCFETFKR